MQNRRRSKRLLAGIALVLFAIGTQALGPGAATAAKGEPLSLDLCAPDQGHEFTLAIDNPYFPLSVGQKWVLSGREQGDTIGLLIEVLDETVTLYRGRDSVETRVVVETEWLDEEPFGSLDAGEELIESSRNYFAQTEEGTVCYFGEDVDIYENGIVVSHEGSWRADDPGNAPGIYMPDSPEVGMTFQQEVAPDVAMDTATIIGTGSVTVPAGTFQNAIKARDFNPLDGSRGVKWYAPGVGIVVDGPLQLVSY